METLGIGHRGSQLLQYPYERLALPRIEILRHAPREKRHPLARKREVTPQDIAAHPMVFYTPGHQWLLSEFDRLFAPLASANRFQYWSLLCVLHAKRFGPEAPLPPSTRAAIASIPT